MDLSIPLWNNRDGVVQTFHTFKRWDANHTKQVAKHKMKTNISQTIEQVLAENNINIANIEAVQTIVSGVTEDAIHESGFAIAAPEGSEFGIDFAVLPLGEGDFDANIKFVEAAQKFLKDFQLTISFDLKDEVEDGFHFEISFPGAKVNDSRS